MKYTQKKDNNTLTITFKMDMTEWNEYDKKAYEQNKNKYSVPGFRKGHVPKFVLEQRYGKGLFFEDALYLAAQEYYTQFLDKNKKVIPVARPAIDDKSIKVDDKGVAFAIVVTVRPDVTLGQYKGLEIKKVVPAEVTAEQVDAELNKVSERNARFVDVTDRAVADGDQVNLNYCGKVDGVAFDGGTAENQTLVIGSHTFIEGFEEQLIGMNIGETKDINVTFPAEYHAENLAGKPAVFTCTINGISVKELPTLDDDFAKDVSEFDTLDEYKASIKKNLEDASQKEADRKNEDALIQTVVENTVIDIPNEMIEEQIDQYLEDFGYQLQQKGLNLDDYFKYTNTTMEQLRANYKDRAQKAVHTRLVFEEIVKVEKIKASKKAVDAKIKEYAENIGQDAKQFAEMLGDNRAYFENQVITEALLDFLKANNTFVD